MLELWHLAPVTLGGGGDEHLYEVYEREEEAERQHAKKEQLLVAAHLPDMAEHRLKRVVVPMVLFIELFFGFLEKIQQTCEFLFIYHKNTIHLTVKL